MLSKSSMGLSQPFQVPLHCAKRLVPESCISPLAKRPHLQIRTEAYQGRGKSTGGSVPASSTDSRKKGSWGYGIREVLQSMISS